MTTAILDVRGRASLNARMTEALRLLEHTIAARRTASPDTSYVARLHAGGMPLIARKFGEEAVEATVAALALDRPALIGEAADVLFHLIVMLNARDISLSDIEHELQRRDGVSGIAEKAARTE